MGESPVEAAWRELAEETGLDERQVELVERVRRLDGVPLADDRCGAVNGSVRPIDGSSSVRSSTRSVRFPTAGSSLTWTWMDPAELIDRVVDFRKQPYRQVLGG